MLKCDYLIVGAGLYGCVLAERIANDLGKHVVVIDKRDHIGGNCFSKEDTETGIEYHPYGTHIFHTSCQKVFDYISRFTSLNHYHHQVLTVHKDRIYQMPINLETINSFFGENYRPVQAKALLRRQIAAENIGDPKNFEEKAISLIGRPLYEAFIKEYTMKQWGVDPRELPSEIIMRLPVRFNYDETYFNEAYWQGIPLKGYAAMFEAMLHFPKIELRLNFDFFDHCREFDVREKIIYTGPIDKYFNYQCGVLDWRVTEFQRKLETEEDFQGTAVMNFADKDIPYIRIHEPKHLHPERFYARDKTVIFYETSRKTSRNEGYYPISTRENKDIVAEYKKLAAKCSNLIIGGRLGDYAYYDMDATIFAALSCYEKRLKSLS